jgi:hypothetical protein
MSKNIDQVFIANPITTNANTDLMYFGQSPYGAGNDAAMLYSNFKLQFGAPFTPAALTEVNDTNVTLSLGGTPATALLQAASITAGWSGTLAGTRGGTGVNNGASTITIGGNLVFSGAFNFTGTLTNTTSVTFPTSGTLATTSQLPSLPLSLANGGTNAALTANNGGIFYSSASAGAILAGTATAQQLLLSGASTTPQWSTSTYPLTNAANSLLYASSSNVMAALLTANSSILTSNGSGVPSWSASLPSGVAPYSTVDQTSGSATLAVNTQYVTDNGASLVTYTLPATAAQGSIFRVFGSSSGGWKIGQATGQTCHVGSSATTAGVGGSIASTNQWDNIELVCTTANTTFAAHGIQGNLTIV